MKGPARPGKEVQTEEAQAEHRKYAQRPRGDRENLPP